MLVFAVDGTLLSCPVMRWDTDSFEFSVLRGWYPKQRPGTVLLIWNPVICPKRERGAKDCQFCCCFAMSSRDCCSSLSLFYREETVQMSAAFLSCISVVDKCCYTSFIEPLNVFHKGKVKSQTVFCVCSAEYSTQGESSLDMGFGWSWCIWSCPQAYF